MNDDLAAVLAESTAESKQAIDRYRLLRDYVLLLLDAADPAAAVTKALWQKDARIDALERHVQRLERPDLYEQFHGRR